MSDTGGVAFQIIVIPATGKAQLTRACMQNRIALQGEKNFIYLSRIRGRTARVPSEVAR